MLKIFRAEHILATIFTVAFLLCDIAVLCFFVTAFDPTPDITSADAVTEHRVIQTPQLSVRNLTTITFGSNVEQKADAVKQLEDALSTQLQTLTQTKNAP